MSFSVFLRTRSIRSLIARRVSQRPFQACHHAAKPLLPSHAEDIVQLPVRDQIVWQCQRRRDRFTVQPHDQQGHQPPHSRRFSRNIRLNVNSPVDRLNPQVNRRLTLPHEARFWKWLAQPLRRQFGQLIGEFDEPFQFLVGFEFVEIFDQFVQFHGMTSHDRHGCGQRRWRWYPKPRETAAGRSHSHRQTFPFRADRRLQSAHTMDGLHHVRPIESECLEDGN